jgi:hypothetical protein
MGVGVGGGGSLKLACPSVGKLQATCFFLPHFGDKKRVVIVTRTLENVDLELESVYAQNASVPNPNSNPLPLTLT